MMAGSQFTFPVLALTLASAAGWSADTLPKTTPATEACKVFHLLMWTRAFNWPYQTIGSWLDRESDCGVDFRRSNGALYVGGYCSGGLYGQTRFYSPDHYEIFFEGAAARPIGEEKWKNAGPDILFRQWFLDRSKLSASGDKLLYQGKEFPTSATRDRRGGSVIDIEGEQGRLSANNRYLAVQGRANCRSCEIYYVDIYELASVTRILTIEGETDMPWGEHLGPLVQQSAWVGGDQYYFLPLSDLTFTQFLLCDVEQIAAERRNP